MDERLKNNIHSVNTLKTAKRVLKGIIWFIIAAYIVTTMMIHFPFVQRWLGNKAAHVIGKKLGTKVYVEKIHLGLLNRIIIDDFELYDQTSTLMLKASRLAAKIDYNNLIKNGQVSISSAQIFGMKGVFYKDDEKSKANFQFVLDSLASKDKSKKSSLELGINSLIIRRGAICYDQRDLPVTPNKFNTKHFNVKNISAHIAIPYYTTDSMALAVKKLSLNEDSGLKLKNLKFNITVDKTKTLIYDFKLQLPQTDIHIGNLSATYEYKNGKLDTNTLKFNGQLNYSKITLSDATPIVSEFKRYTNPIFITSSFKGIGKHIDINKLDINTFDSNISLSATGALTKTNNLLAWKAHINQLNCTSHGMDKIFATIEAEESTLTKILTHFGNLKFIGAASGFNEKINIDCILHSSVGNISMKAARHGKHINADIKTSGIDLGSLLADKKLGLLAANVNIKCDTNKKKLSNIKINGTFPRFDYKGYSYTNITANGFYDKHQFNGRLGIDDPNGQVTLEGRMNLNRSKQETDIKASIRNLDLAAMNITDKWKGAKFDLEAKADTHVSDTETNIFKGKVAIKNFLMASAEKTYKLDSLTITAQKGSLVMQSDFGYAEISGQYKLKDIPNSITNILYPQMPWLFTANKTTDNAFLFKANITKTDWLATLFNIPLNLNSPLNITANVNNRENDLNLRCVTNKFTYDGNPYEKLNLTIGMNNDTLAIGSKLRKIMSNGHKLDFSVIANVAADKMTTSIHWDNNQKKPMKGTLNSETNFIKRDDGKLDVNINVRPSQILVKDTAWNVLPANILYSGGDLTVNHFSIEHNRQHIRIDGKATKHLTDSITIDLQDVDVNYILGLVNFHSVEFGGYMSGKAYVKSAFYEPDAYANLIVNNFTFENGHLGKLLAKVNWNKIDKQIDIDAVADDKPAYTKIKGNVSPSRNDINLSITANNTNISFLESFCGAFMTDIKGVANGEVRLHGPLDAIDLTGTLVADGHARIIPTNVTYSLVNDTIRFVPNNIIFNADTIRDRNGNIGIVNGALHHDHLKELTYDIGITTKNLLCYDTKGFGDNSFYGTAYGTGKCTIEGGDGEVNIDIDLTPGKDSFIEYNVASPETITDQQFITWHDKTEYALNDSISSGSLIIEHSTDMPPADIPSDMHINFLINMTPEASLRVLMDPNTKDYISLNGNGTLRASYFNKGSFDIFGTFIINQGTYTLTIQNIIKKIFQFQRGGTIVFGGDPYDALLDLQAVYTVNSVPLSDLQLGNSFSSNNVRVDCLMNISGTPLSPHVDFNIDMPTVNEDAEQMVRTVINSEEEMNQQVVYLLSVGRFYMQNNNSSEQGKQNQTSLAMQSLLSGTISQQINTLFGNIVKDNNWTFGANISTGDEGFNNAEYEGLLSGKLFNNRLIINGQFGYRDNKNATTSFIGDFDINYLLLPNGNISIKVYNQTNDRYFTKSSLNTQGIGLMLKKDFNSLMELFGYKRRKNNK